ncbi:hypothetical protein ACN47E_009173 [Coniothyrium glycines]
MTRVQHARGQHAHQRSITLEQARAVHQKRKPYKIVLEAVTQEKKKLHSILTYASNAPTGFGFVPAGHPDFTEWCKEQCRQRNLDVHIVSAKPKNKMHADPEKLSHHVHRVGHHFPLEIIRLACSKFGYTYDDVNGLKKAKTSDRINWIAQSMEEYGSRQALHGRPSNEKETKDYIQGAVREMFPKIPEADLAAIVNHAFEEGTNRVGNAKELPLARRVQLAVVAHIRHMYTDYDKLLKTGGWMEARSKVEHVSLAKLKEWRDEVGEGSNELEETFREVIVLDDDDDDASSDGDPLSSPNERDQSMEIVSSRATARDLQPERYPDYPRIDVHDMRRAPRRTIVVQRYPPPPPSASSAGPSRSLQISRHPHTSTGSAQYSSRPSSRGRETFRLAHSRPMDSLAASQPGPRAGPLMRDAEGRLYQLRPIENPVGEPRVNGRISRRVTPHRVQDPYAQYPPPPIAYNHPTHSRRASEQEVVLPSVERETVDLTSPRPVANGHSPMQMPPRNFADIHSPKRKALPFSMDDGDIRPHENVKRVRPAYYENERSRQIHHCVEGTVSNELRGQALSQPPQPVIDLASSPYRFPPSGARDGYEPAQSYRQIEPPRHPYVPVPPHPPPRLEANGAQYAERGDILDHGFAYEPRASERRTYAPRDFIPLGNEGLRPYNGGESARHLRGGVKYGDWR